MQYDAFISYRRNNGFLMANYIYEHLKGEKVSCFLDPMELGSEDFHEKILKEVIPNTQYFILILAPGVLDNCTEKGDWLRREIYTAQKNKATIIKVMYNGFTWPKEKAKSFPDYIKKIDKLNGIEVNQYSLGDLTGNLLNFMPSVKRKPSPKKN